MFFEKEEQHSLLKDGEEIPFNIFHQEQDDLSQENNRNPQPYQASFLDKVVYALLLTYAFHGYDIRKKWISTSQGRQKFSKAEDYEHYRVSFWLIFVSFCGLPSRIETISTSEDEIPRYLLKINWLQFLRGFIGGWDPLHENGVFVPTLKKSLQIAAILIKGLIILPLKIISFPFKLLINIAKLFSEFLPLILTYIFGPLLAASFNKMRESAKDSVLGAYRLVIVPFYFLTTIITLIPFLLFRSLHFFGMALTSPDTSARHSYTFGYKSIRPLLEFFNVHKYSKTGRALSFIAGSLCALGSVLTTLGLWAVTFPLLFGAMLSYIPIVQQLVLGISKLPLIASYLTSLEGALAIIGISTAHVYGTIIITIGSIFNIQISSLVLLVGTAFGALGAPVFTIVSRVTDVLCDWWANWQKQPFFSHLLTLIIPHKHKHTADSSEKIPDPEHPPATLSERAEVLVQDDQALTEVASLLVSQTNRTQGEVERPPVTTTNKHNPKKDLFNVESDDDLFYPCN